jgi:transcriptional regulator with XRE-family HTH domain
MKNFGSLDNYIEMHRKRAGLSQAELSYLISLEKGSSISRYEQGLRFPNLESLLALEVVLGQPVSELYAGIKERMEEEVAEKARHLLGTLGDAPSKELALKLELLARLAHPDEPNVVPIWDEE